MQVFTLHTKSSLTIALVSVVDGVSEMQIPRALSMLNLLHKTPNVFEQKKITNLLNFQL